MRLWTLSSMCISGGNMLTDATSGGGTHQPSVTLTSGYDAYHDRTSLSDSITGNAGIITYQYDAAFRLTTISASYNGAAGPQILFGYDPANQLTSLSRTIGGLGTSVNTSIVYDSANRVGTITDQTGTGTALATYLYGYDNANRVTTEVNAEGTVTYSYDSGGELLTAKGSRTENYSYDSGGNRNMSGYTTGTGNELQSGGGYTFTYDNEGNTIGETQLSNGNVWTFSYDDRNRMMSAVEKNSGGTTLEQVTYTYDALDHRIGVDTNGTQMWTVYDGQGPDANPYADFSASGTLLTRYVYGPAVDEILARTSSGGTTAWYLTDRLGSIRDIVSTTGAELDHIVYDSYGDILSESSGGNGDRFKFTGMEWDAAIGQYYDHARWYGAGVGRFLEQDPYWFRAGDRNLYRYVSNNTTNAVDATGSNALTLTAIASGGGLLLTGAGVITVAGSAIIGAELAYGYHLSEQWYEAYQAEQSFKLAGDVLTQKIKYAQNVYAIKLYGRAMMAHATKELEEEIQAVKDELAKIASSMAVWDVLGNDSEPPDDPEDDEIWSQVQGVMRESLDTLKDKMEDLLIKLSELMNRRGQPGPGGGNPPGPGGASPPGPGGLSSPS